MNALLRSFLRADRVPLAFRRQVARAFVPMTGEEFALDVGGVTYRGRLDSYLEWMVWVTGQFFEFTYLNLIRSFHLRGAAVDVGANVGNHSLALSTMFDEVIALEPFEPIYRRLEAKVRDAPNVRIHNVGLGNRASQVRFAPPVGQNTGTGRVAEEGTEAITIHRGDEFLPSVATQPIRFVKIDVEGYEEEVLRGLSSLLTAQRPVVFYESFRTAGRPRAEAMRASFALFPAGYEFWGLRGQTTFPIQRSVARPVRLTGRRLGRRYSYVLAIPGEAGLLKIWGVNP